jgi:hypothetical protein
MLFGEKRSAFLSIRKSVGQMKQASTNYPPRFEVLRRGTVTITATPPTIAKSTLARTRPANNFSNRESVSLDDGWFSVSVFFEKLTHFLELPQHLTGSRGPPDLAPDRK